MELHCGRYYDYVTPEALQRSKTCRLAGDVCQQIITSITEMPLTCKEIHSKDVSKNFTSVQHAHDLLQVNAAGTE